MGELRTGIVRHSSDDRQDFRRRAARTPRLRRAGVQSAAFNRMKGLHPDNWVTKGIDVERIKGLRLSTTFDTVRDKMKICQMTNEACREYHDPDVGRLTFV